MTRVGITMSSLGRMTMSTLTRTMLMTVGLATAGVLIGAGTTGSSSSTTVSSDDPYANLPSSIQLTGVVRDFREASVTNGHKDFELTPSAGFGHYFGLVQDTLDSDGKPQYQSTGYLVKSEWKDAQGRNVIQPRSYISAKSGDKAGSVSASQGGALNSSALFAQWYRDVPGVNVSKQLTINLQRQPNSNLYVFDDKSDTGYAGKGGFFPIDADLFGNSAGTPVHNFHFTYELETQFSYTKGKGDTFRFIGDDDVWVFIDGKLVIDIGGIHSATDQVIELDRLSWLQDGMTYKLKIFQAERHRTQSNFRVETTLTLRTVAPPPVSALAD